MHNETTISSETLYSGRILNLRRDTVALKDGKTGYREIVEHAPAVVVLPIHSDGTVTLIRQFRKAVESDLIEAVAGMIDPNEPPIEAAKRELREETGIGAQRWNKVGEGYPAPGFTDEYLHFYVAQDLNQLECDLDDDEDIESFRVPLAAAFERVSKGEIIDIKTQLILFWAKQHIG